MVGECVFVCISYFFIFVPPDYISFVLLSVDLVFIFFKVSTLKYDEKNPQKT